MTFASEELEGGVTKVILNGRMDIEGSAAIDLRMMLWAEPRRSYWWICRTYRSLARWGCARWCFRRKR